MQFNDFLSLQYISTFLGTIIVTMLIVQFTKDLKFIKDIPTRYFTFLVAFINILICSILTHSFSITNLYLMIINSVLVTFTSTGGYDFSVKKVSMNDDTGNKIDNKIDKV